MKKIIILGASMLQVPMIELAKDMGLYVIVVDYNPKAPGMFLADEPLVVSTIDKEAVYIEAVRTKPDYIVTCTSDMPVRTVAYIREKFGMPVDIAYKDSFCATDKIHMRKRLQEFDVPIPKFYVVENEGDYINALKNFDDVFIVKPSDNAASRGVCLGNVNSDDLLSFYNYSKASSRSGRVLVEEYMLGKEVSVESFTNNGITTVISITDKITTGAPHFVELGHSEPSELPNCVQKKIIEITKRAIAAINIINGPSHTEICITSDGPKIVEIAARLGGDFITSKLVPLTTGVNMVENSLYQVLNLPMDLVAKKIRLQLLCLLKQKKELLSQ